MNPSVHYSLSGGHVPRGVIQGVPQELAFSTPEYQRRMRLVRDGMTKDGIDLLLVFDPPNVFYLSGFQSFAMYNNECIILPLKGEPHLIVDPPEIGGALMHSWFDNVYGYPPNEGRESFLSKLIINQKGVSPKIAVETNSRALPVRFYEAFRNHLPKANFIDGSDLVPQVKTTKSEEEIAHLRHSASLTDAGMSAAINAIEVGASDNDVAVAAYETMINGGSEYMCVDPIVTSGIRSSILHSNHKRITLNTGDTLLMELGACIQRYTAPTMRAAVIGEPSAEVRRVADACLGALDNVLSSLKAGISAHEVATAGWKALREAGDDIVFHGSFGYAIGAGFPPTWADNTGAIAWGNHTPLIAGQVFHHPVAVRKLGKFGVAFSETTVITENGCEVLTGSPRELAVR